MIALAQPGRIRKIEVDTAHFKGNYPDRVSLDAALFGKEELAAADDERWQVLLPESKLAMDAQHEFESELLALGAVSHVRMSIFPDGGISRLRLYGRASEDTS